MKKFFFVLAALAATASVSCSKDDDVSVDNYSSAIVGKWDFYMEKTLHNGEVYDILNFADYGDQFTYEFYEDNTGVITQYEGGKWEDPIYFIYSVEGSILKWQEVDDDGTVSEWVDYYTIKKLTSKELELYISYPEEDNYEGYYYCRRL